MANNSRLRKQITFWYWQKRLKARKLNGNNSHLIYFCYIFRFPEMCFSPYLLPQGHHRFEKKLLSFFFYGCCQFLVNVESNKKACHKYAGFTSTTFRYVRSSLCNENITFHFKYNFMTIKRILLFFLLQPK